MNARSHAVHLSRRALGSVSNAGPSTKDLERVAETLLSRELVLWSGMQGRDQRHSIQVMDRFVRLRPEATRAERAAALLHDVGKSHSRLGWLGRIVATVVGPRTPQMRAYLDHERIGLELLADVSDPRTLFLLSPDSRDDAADALRAADDL